MPACHAGDRRFESGRVRQSFFEGSAKKLAADRRLIAVALVALAFVIGAAIFLLNPARPAETARPTAPAVAASPNTAQPTIRQTDGATPTSRPTDQATSTPTSTPPPAAGMVEMPFVPVVGFWSTEQGLSMRELVELVSTGSDARHPSVILPTDDAAALADALNVDSPNVRTGTVEEIESAVRDGALGILRVIDVTPAVRALELQGISMFGNDRVTDIHEVPLRAFVSATQRWDPAASWTWVAAGDVMMDRGVALSVREHGGDGDYLFDGGTARVTGVRCCSFFGFKYPTTARTGNGGALRDLFSSADVATANLESAVLVDAPWHRQGLTFTADASLLDSVDRAGFDFMSLANNHVRNAGPRGIRTAVEQLDERGIVHSGAGLADEAGQPGYVEVNGVRIAIISCDAIANYATAGPEKVGTFNCRRSDVVGRIREVRPTADLVVIYPHWGREYHPKPAPYQPVLAKSWFDAGADLVIGAHSHVAGAIGDIDGHVVFYSLGNLIFDQDFRQSTMMGAVPEMTFYGSRLMQIELHSTLIIDSQPNLVPAAQGGEFVFNQMREASAGAFDY